MANERYQPPKPTVGDAAHAVAKAGISTLPYVGGPAVELFQAIVMPPLEKRRAAWMSEVAEGLRRLERNKGVKLDELKDNEQFISTLMQASNIVTRTHQEEKRKALLNAVLNSSLPSPPEDAVQQIFLNYIDSFTEWHLRILKLFQNPPPIEGVTMGGLSMVITRNYPELRDKELLYRQVWKDFWTAGLVNTDSINGTMSGRGLAEKRTTEWGDKFLNFVAEPDQKKN